METRSVATINDTTCDFDVSGDASEYIFSHSDEDGDVLTIKGVEHTISMKEGVKKTAQRIEVTGAATITLNGVYIEDTNDAAGIGSGYGSGSNIEISGSKITATGGGGGAGIGGCSSERNDIKITGGVVTATGGLMELEDQGTAYKFTGAGIGGGSSMNQDSGGASKNSISGNAIISADSGGEDTYAGETK